jgi:hypothetical protein
VELAEEGLEPEGGAMDVDNPAFLVAVVLERVGDTARDYDLLASLKPAPTPVEEDVDRSGEHFVALLGARVKMDGRPPACGSTLLIVSNASPPLSSVVRTISQLIGAPG